MVAFKQFFFLKKTKQNKTKTNKKNFFSTSNSVSNYFNKLINILFMFSFLFNTFINLYLGLVVSLFRDLNPQYNFSITASWWGSMLANSFKFKSAQGFIHKPSGINNSEISCQCFLYRLYGQWSVLANSKSERGPVNQREGQIIIEYLAVLVESRIECETTHTSTDILTEKGLTPWTKAMQISDCFGWKS